MTQDQLADAVGVTKSAVCHWEKCFSRPGLERIAAVAAALDVSIEELIEGEQAA